MPRSQNVLADKLTHVSRLAGKDVDASGVIRDDPGASSQEILDRLGVSSAEGVFHTGAGNSNSRG